MSKFMTATKRFLAGEEALELSEYAIMLALLAIVIIVAITALSGAISGVMNQAATVISGGGGS